MGDDTNVRLSKERLTSLYKFLREYVQLRYNFPREINNHPWYRWLKDFPEHHAIQRRLVIYSDDDDEYRENCVSEIGSYDTVIAVRRPQLTEPPKLPKSLEGWLQPGWDDPFQEAKPYSSRNAQDAYQNTQVVRFEDDKQREKDLQKWLSLRAKWAENERPAREAMRVFEDLYELYGQLSREGGRFELVVGDGILSWTYEHGSIYHPLILIPVQLEFDADVPEFRIIDIGATPELYTAALRDTNVDPQQLGRIRQELESGGFHPLGSGDASGFLRRLVQALSPHGQFVESGLPPKKRSSQLSDDIQCSFCVSAIKVLQMQ